MTHHFLLFAHAFIYTLDFEIGNSDLSNSHSKFPGQHGKTHSLPPQLEAKAKYTLCSSVFPPNTVLVSGCIRHNQEIAQFQIDIALHCKKDVKRRCSIIWRALVFCWHRPQLEIGQLQHCLPQQLWKEELIQYQSCLGLCWHPTPPAIGQLQGALSQLP